MSRVNWGDLCGALTALEDRVAELEKQATTRGPSPTHDGRIVVDANEYDRLVGIEKAAREALRNTEACQCGDIGAHGHHLSEALKR